VTTSPTNDDYNRQQANGWSEKAFQAAVVGFAQRLNFLVYHTYDSRRSKAGYPDLHLVHATTGRSLFRELKTQRGTVTAEQQEWLTALAAGGADVAVWRPLDWFDHTIRDQLYGPDPD
jgi:hypothetical protein